MNKFVLIGLLLFSIKAVSQTTTSEAVAIGDSILKSKIGDRLFQYFSLSEGSYYTYYDKHLRQEMGKFLSKKKLPESFTTLNFLYHFNYPEIKGVKGGLWLIVDKDFKLTDTLNFDYIPQFLIKDKSSDFIPVDSVLKIAKKNFKQTGSLYSASTPELTYSEKLHQYIYTVYNELSLTSTEKNPRKEKEFIEINAITGKVENIGKGWFGGIIIR